MVDSITAKTAVDGVPQLIAKGMAALAGELILLQAEAGLVSQQHNLNPAYFPEKERAAAKSMLEHQLAARESAHLVLGAISVETIELLSSLSGTAVEYEIVTGAMEKILQKAALSTDDRQVITHFTEELHTSAVSRAANATALMLTFDMLANNLKKSEEDFSKDYQAIYDSVTASSGRISEINDELHALRSSMEQQIAGIIIGSLGGGAGVALIAAGALGTFTGAIGVMISGITAVVGATTGVTIASVKLKNDMHKMADLYRELSGLNISLTVNTVFGEQISGLLEATRDMQSAITGLGHALKMTATELDTLREDVRAALDADDTAKALAILRRHKLDMQTIVDEERRIMSRLSGTPVITVANLLALD